ncbi:MAG: tellurite resistance TerB family protein [Gammaproteobacteria bacterium]
MNTMDLLGVLMKNGMSRSGGRRIEHSMGGGGMGAPGSILDQVLGGGAGPSTGSGGLMDMLGKLAGSLDRGASRTGGPGGMGTAGRGGGLLESLAGAMFGGSSGSTPSAAGAGSMAVLGGLALEALRKMGGDSATTQSVALDDATRLTAGLRKPANAQEEQQLMDVASLIVKAMINAAKADGRIDEAETDRIVGKLREGGLSDEEQHFLVQEMRKPLDIDSIARAVPNQQVATQVYAASLLAIEVDTDQERRYLRELAAALGLDSNTVTYLHGALGVSALH